MPVNGWPACPACHADALWSPASVAAIREAAGKDAPIPVETIVANGMTCRACGWSGVP